MVIGEAIYRTDAITVFAGTLRVGRGGAPRSVVVKEVRGEALSDDLEVEAQVHELVYAASLAVAGAARVPEPLGFRRLEPASARLVMERVEGESFDRLLRTMDCDTEQSVMHQVATLLEHLQRRLGFLHGDLHGKNVMVDASGTAFVLDFGLSRIVVDGAALCATCPLLAKYREFGAGCAGDGAAAARCEHMTRALATLNCSHDLRRLATYHCAEYAQSKSHSHRPSTVSDLQFSSVFFFREWLRRVYEASDDRTCSIMTRTRARVRWNSPKSESATGNVP